MNINKISEIQFVPVHPQNGLIGFTSFIWDKTLKISGVGVHTTISGGIRLVYPTGKFGHLVFPICKETGEIITRNVADKVRSILVS